MTDARKLTVKLASAARASPEEIKSGIVHRSILSTSNEDRPACNPDPIPRVETDEVESAKERGGLAGVHIEPCPPQYPAELHDVSRQMLRRHLHPAPQRPFGTRVSIGMLRSDRNLQQIDSTMRRFECSAILFDLDGVLVDSTRQVEAQWRAWASAKGLAAEPFLEICHGRRALETIRLAAPQLDAEAEVAAFQPEEGKDGLIGPVPGAARLLENLPVGSWAVATSGTRRMASERLRQAGLPLPSVLVCAEDVLHGKPSPGSVLAGGGWTRGRSG